MSLSPNPTKILIVDDTPANIDVLRGYLSQQGYRLAIATNGEKALKIANRLLPNLILLDVMMPGIDGFEVCHRLKAQPETKDIPVIFMTALHDKKDKVKGFELGAVDYITKPLSYEEVVARVNTHIKLQAHTDKLAVALDKAEAANRAKNTLLAKTSHELRTPLNAIIGYADMLREDALDSGLAESIPDLAKIKTSANQLLNIISDMLDIAKIEADNMELHLVETDILSLVNDTIAIIQPSIQTDRLCLNVECDDDLGRMETDSTRLRQILLNLLNNALKFTKQGDVFFNVRADKDEVCFKVIDEGIGIEDEQLAWIFSAFSQADNSSTRKFGGLGLGLTIASHFSKLMGGRIEVSSIVNKGSIFTVYLPRKQPIPPVFVLDATH